MSLTAEVREHRIRVALRAVIEAIERGRKAEARQLFNDARQLIAARSAAMVARLERERGLTGREAA